MKYTKHHSLINVPVLSNFTAFKLSIIVCIFILFIIFALEGKILGAEGALTCNSVVADIGYETNIISIDLGGNVIVSEIKLPNVMPISNGYVVNKKQETTFVYKNDEGVFTFAINQKTLKTCRTFDRVNRLCVNYQQNPKSKFEENIILSNIEGFNYDSTYSYLIEIERLRDPNTYGALDVSWYKYKLIRILKKIPNDNE